MAKAKWEVGPKLRSARLAAGLSQVHLADHLNLAVATYRTYENGSIPRDQAIRGVLTNWLESQQKKPSFIIKSSTPEAKSPMVRIVELLDSYRQTPTSEFKRLRALVKACIDGNCSLGHLDMLLAVMEGSRMLP